MKNDKKTKQKKLSKDKKSKVLVSLPKADESEQKTTIRRPKIDWTEMTVSAASMADLLDMTTMNVGRIAKQGKITKNPDGSFTVGPCVKSYIESLRHRNEVEKEAKADGQETEYWRVAKLKQQSNEGRSQIADEILASLLTVWRTAGERLMEQVKDAKTLEFLRMLFTGFEDVAKSININDMIGEQEDEAEERPDDIESDEE